MNDIIDSRKMKAMFLGGTRYLDNQKDMINALNVFPVPDGDTGTNMSLTLMSAARELKDLSDDASIDDVGRKIASGTLRGARGNSGVIMSQLCRGFVKGIEGAKALNSTLIAAACDMAVSAAYKAVMRPQEGTILTVAREVALRASELAARDITLKEFFSSLLSYGREVLQHTPELLPVLKEAGVVDSGGQGLIEFLRGAFDAFEGKTQDYDFEPEKETISSHPVSIDTSNIETADIRFGYCTEFLIETKALFTSADEEELKMFLNSIGDSIVCVAMDDIVKVHVHTNHPGQAIEKALTYGELNSLKIDNMRFEHHEKLVKESDYRNETLQGEMPSDTVTEESRAELGFAAVCSGEGIAEVFKGLKVDAVIEGGQTMNPSTEDILAAIDTVRADHVILFPNNSNIIMTASQAAQMCTDKTVHVIPTKNICQGITAMIGYVPSFSAEENVQLMKDAMQQVRCGEVTYAIRDSRIGETCIRKGDYMGIGDGELLAVCPDEKDAAVEMIRKMARENAEFITIYYGEGTTEEDAQEVACKVGEFLPDVDTEITYGGQAVYQFIISVE